MGEIILDMVVKDGLNMAQFVVFLYDYVPLTG